MNSKFTTDSEKLLDYIKKQKTPPGTHARLPSPHDWQRWQIEEQQQFESQTQILVYWHDLTPDEQVQEKLSGSELYRQYSMIDQQDVRRYWEHAFDMPMIKKYLDLIDNEPTDEQ